MHARQGLEGAASRGRLSAKAVGSALAVQQRTQHLVAGSEDGEVRQECVLGNQLADDVGFKSAANLGCLCERCRDTTIRRGGLRHQLPPKSGSATIGDVVCRCTQRRLGGIHAGQADGGDR